MPEQVKRARKKKRSEEFWIELCGRPVPAINTAEGVRAVSGTKAIESHGVQRYLESKFGNSLKPAHDSMTAVAKALKPERLERDAFRLYEQFRPEIPEGTRGWGATGELDLTLIRRLASNKH